MSSSLINQLASQIYQTYGAQMYIKPWFENPAFQEFLISQIEQYISKIAREAIRVLDNMEFGEIDHVSYELVSLIRNSMDGTKESLSEHIFEQLKPPLLDFFMKHEHLCEQINRLEQDSDRDWIQQFIT